MTAPPQPSNKPTYLLIVAMSIIGMLGAMIIFTNNQNNNVIIAMQTILSLAGLAYGVTIAQAAKA